MRRFWSEEYAYQSRGTAGRQWMCWVRLGWVRLGCEFPLSVLLVFHAASSCAAIRCCPGKDVYFWSLLSALGTFWLGAGVTMRHSIEEFMHPTVLLDKVWYFHRNMFRSMALSSSTIAPSTGIGPRTESYTSVNGYTIVNGYFVCSCPKKSLKEKRGQ